MEDGAPTGRRSNADYQSSAVVDDDVRTARDRLDGSLAGQQV